MTKENQKIKTIRIELLEGTPGGFRRAEFTTQLMRVLVAPRDRQELLESCPEATFQAVYLIVGENEKGEPKVYIGKTRRMALRIKEHNKSGQRDFWQNVLYFVTKDDSLTSTEIEYLEWLLIKQAAEAGNFIIDNGTRGYKKEPQVEPAKRADFADYYNQIVALTEVLGYGGIFNRIRGPEPELADRYSCESAKNGVKGEMVCREDGFFVLAGSICASSVADCASGSVAEMRKKLLATGILKTQSGKLSFTQDYKFQTPSGAAAVLYGRNMNGWTTWKNHNGKTLDEVIRR